MWTQLTPTSEVPLGAEVEMRIFFGLTNENPDHGMRRRVHFHRVGRLDYAVRRVVTDLAPPTKADLSEWVRSAEDGGPVVWRCRHRAYDHRKPHMLDPFESDFVQIVYREDMSDYVLK